MLTNSSAAAATAFITDGPKGSFVIYDYAVSLLAIIINAVILRSVIKARIHLTGYKFFLVSLGVSDLYVGCVNVVILATDAALIHHLNSKCIAQIFRSLQMSSLVINLLNLCGMSLDHLIGIVYPFAYGRIMGRRTMTWAVGILWSLSLLLGSLELPLTTITYLNQPEHHFTASQQETQQMDPLMKSNCTFIPKDGSNIINNSPTIVKEAKLLLSRLTNSTRGQKFKPLLLALIFGSEDDGDFSEEIDDYDDDQQLHQFITTTTTTTKLQLFSRRISNNQSSSPAVMTAMKPQLNYSCVFNKILASIENASDIVMSTDDAQYRTWCQLYKNTHNLEYIIMALTVVCFIFIAYCYGKIFQEMIKRRQDEETQQKRNLNRFVMTTVLLLANFSICYLVYMVFEIAMLIAMSFGWQNMAVTWPTLMIVQNVLGSLLLTSPLIQPLIYAGRLSTVRSQIFRDLNLSGWQRKL